MGRYGSHWLLLLCEERGSQNSGGSFCLPATSLISSYTARANGYWARRKDSGSAPLSRAYALTPPTARRPASLPHSGLNVRSEQQARVLQPTRPAALLGASRLPAGRGAFAPRGRPAIRLGQRAVSRSRRVPSGAGARRRRRRASSERQRGIGVFPKRSHVPVGSNVASGGRRSRVPAPPAR